MTRTDLYAQIEMYKDIPLIADGIALVNTAREYALRMHGDQKYGEEPYSVHLEAVESVLIEFDHNHSVLRAAAWLHDLEDVFSLETEEHRQRFEQEFKAQFSDYIGGRWLFTIVEAVTTEPGKNRKERNRKTYPKIARQEDSIILKLADRIANARNSKANNAGLFAMYKKEYPEFKEALYTQSIVTQAMWEELDNLFN